MNSYFSLNSNNENGDVPMPFVVSFQRGMGESPFLGTFSVSC
jgi:hypothetical protein